MKRVRACPYCKSPARGNPCWYGITIGKQFAGMGFDPPCAGDDYVEFERGRTRWALILVAALVAALVALFLASRAGAQEYHSNPWLKSWIPATCCVTNDCCWEIQERELTARPDDHWEIRSTGQVRKRTGWSPDGKFYRCACDYDNEHKVWNRHQGANTRCLFVPMRLF